MPLRVAKVRMDSNEQDGYTNYEQDIVTPPTAVMRWGRCTAQEEALERFKQELATLAANELGEEQLERMLLRVFDAGYGFAAHMAVTDENVNSLALHPQQISDIPTVLETLKRYNEDSPNEHWSKSLDLLVSFVQARGDACVFDEFLKLINMEKEKLK